jgi:HD-GYP domain-containing protein (c-di-GMP phosphodiesterase class II)
MKREASAGIARFSSGGAVRKINPELWLLLFLVLIAAMLNFLVASQRMALVFYFLPTLFSAYHFGRRHATLTALASVVLVVLLAFVNPAMFTRHVELPFDGRWFDLTLWGGVLMIAGYATGTLYERNQKTLREMEDGYDGMLAILQNFLANQKHNDTYAYRISMCATKIAEAVGLDAGSVEDIRMAALLFNMKELGVTDEVLCKAAQVSVEDLQVWQHHGKEGTKAGPLSGSLRRAIPIFLTERELRRTGGKPDDASFEVQVVLLAEEYQALTSGDRGTKMSPSQAGQEVIKRAGNRYDSLVLNGFTSAFGGDSKGAGA